jgi:hypothetical protein
MDMKPYAVCWSVAALTSTQKTCAELLFDARQLCALVFTSTNPSCVFQLWLHCTHDSFEE